MTRPIVFVDVETDGLGPRCRVWEIAMIRRDPDGTEQRKHMWVALAMTEHTDRKGLDIGGYFRRHPVGRKISGEADRDPKPCDKAEVVYTGHDAAKTVMQWTHDATLVGSAVHFDAGVLDRLLRSHGYLPTWHHRLRCVTTLAAGHLGKETGGLLDSADALGISSADLTAHHAMDDAVLAQRIWDEVMRPEPRG